MTASPLQRILSMASSGMLLVAGVVWMVATCALAVAAAASAGEVWMLATGLWFAVPGAGLAATGLLGLASLRPPRAGR